MFSETELVLLMGRINFVPFHNIPLAAMCKQDRSQWIRWWRWRRLLIACTNASRILCEYGTIFFGLLTRNARVEGRIERVGSCCECFPPANCSGSIPLIIQNHVPCCGSGCSIIETNREAISRDESDNSEETLLWMAWKAMGQAEPALAVRVYDAKPVHSGDVSLSTISPTEREGTEGNLAKLN